MSQLPVAEDPSACEPRGWKLLKSMSTGVSAVSDANVVVVPVVFMGVCLLALDVDSTTPDAGLAIAQFGPYP